MDIKSFKFLRNNTDEDDRSEQLMNWFNSFMEDVQSGKIVLKRYPHDQQSTLDSSSSKSIPSNGELTSIETGDLFSQG